MSNPVADITVRVVSVALKEVDIIVVASIAFFSDELSDLTILTDPPYSRNCAAENQYS